MINHKMKKLRWMKGKQKEKLFSGLRLTGK